ncbi:MAG TPA: stage III sporulation protein AE [Firmicutes bacterium]|nr:stage III sporulation protein AE [Bacillota bacterium]
MNINKTPIKTKALAMIVSIILITLSAPVCAADDETDATTDGIINEYSNFYGEQLQDAWNDLYSDISPNLPADLDISQLIASIAKGDLGFNVTDILNWLIKAFANEVYASVKLLTLVLALAVVSSYLTNLNDSFGKNGIGVIAHYICIILISSVAVTAFYQVVSSAAMAAENLSVFMRMIVPLMLAALLSSGAIVSASVFEPVLLTIIELSVSLIQNLFIPVVMLLSALSIVNSLSDKFKASRLVTLLENFIKRGLSVLLTVFVAFAGLQSIASSGADGLTIKLTKFASSNLIPVVGGILSESVETIMNCSVVIKNSVGIVGIIIVVFISITPLLKIMASLFVFRVIAAMCEPVSDSKTTACLTCLADSISLVFSMLAAITVMFVIIITIIINTGNLAAALGR